MNYLGHAYFSYGHPGILVGNLISDFVKGKKKFDYPLDIQKGISLHREIDDFSDTHAATRNAKEIFRPYYRLYASAFMDVTYDHFIANDPELFSEATLYVFTQETYQTLDEQQEWLPEQFSRIFPYMKTQNWLFNYRHRWGIERSFAGLVRRSKYLTESNTAFRLFEDNIDVLQNCYDQFSGDIKNFAKKRFEALLNGL